MKTRESKQTALQAMEVYLAAIHNPDALRVSESGKVSLANGLTVLFNRVARSVKLAKDSNYKPTDWQKQAHTVVLQRMIKEVGSMTEQVSREDGEKLDGIFNRLSQKIKMNGDFDWREQLSREIFEIDKNANFSSLASALKKITFLDRPENAALSTYVRPHLKGNNNFSQALYQGLTSFLKKEYGLNSGSAENAAKTMQCLMEKYDSSAQEAFFITSRAGEMTLSNELDHAKEATLPLAYLQIHHGLTLNEAKKIYATVKASGQNISNVRETVSVMQIYNVNFDEADAIVSMARSLNQTTLKVLSQAQRVEISWLRLHTDLAHDEAVLTSLACGQLDGQIPPKREIELAATNKKLQKKIDDATRAVMPAGWPDEWELMPDGSRRLKNTADFEKEFMDFFQDSLNDSVINEKRGLSDKFLQDVGRSKFKFGTGKTGVIVSTDPIKATAELEKFVPDALARQTLSKALFQAGGNGLEWATSVGLAAPGQQRFGILPLDQRNEKQDTSADYWMSLQHTEDGKIRVGYTLYRKHFTLVDEKTGRQLPMNARYSSGNSSSNPANAEDHTSQAMALLEFDYAQLSQGILEPKWVRPAELRLTIEPDHETLMMTMVDEILETFN